MAREMLNLASILDCLVTGQIALAADTTVQRMKALESIAAGAAYHIAQRMELVPSEFSLLASQSEAVAAAKESKEEFRTSTMQRGQWEQTSWKGSKGESKGKTEGKSKSKEKGRGKGQKGDEKEKNKGDK